MSVLDTFTELLTGAVGNGLENAPADVRKTKRNLRRLGLFGEETERGVFEALSGRRADEVS